MASTLRVATDLLTLRECGVGMGCSGCVAKTKDCSGWVLALVVVGERGGVDVRGGVEEALYSRGPRSEREALYSCGPGVKGS